MHRSNAGNRDSRSESETQMTAYAVYVLVGLMPPVEAFATNSGIQLKSTSA